MLVHDVEKESERNTNEIFAAGWLAFAPQCEQCAYAASTHVASLISLLSPLMFLCPFAPYNAVFCIASAVVSSAHDPLGCTRTIDYAMPWTIA